MPDTTTHITTSGCLITTAFIENIRSYGKEKRSGIRELDTRQRGTEPEAFALPWADPPKGRAAQEEEIAAAWELILERWDAIQDEIRAMDVSQVRERWLLPLFSLLDFDPVYLRGDVVLDEEGKLRYPISHRGWDGEDAPALHTVPPSQDLDERGASTGSARGIKAKSPHDLLQAFLVGSHDDDWAVLSNGLLLRVLRKYYHIYTKGYVQFDLEAIFETRNYADFVGGTPPALYRMCHASRFIPQDEEVTGTSEEPVTLCPLEKFYKDSLAAGVKVGEDLRRQVRQAIETLGNGFLATSPDLTCRLQDDDALCRRYYGEILRVIYRVLFLLFAEQRGMMPGRGSLYAETYSIAALRSRAEEPPSYRPTDEERSNHTDLWEGLKVTFRMVREGVPALGIFGYDGMLFLDRAEDQTPLLEGRTTCGERSRTIRNGDLLRTIRALTLIQREGVLQRISYADLGVEELGSIYESLLDFTPRVTREREVIDGQEIPSHTFVLDPRGSERKTTGSYYTHDSLVDELIKSALLPVARERLAEAGLPVVSEDLTGFQDLSGLLTDYAALTETQREAGAEALLSLKVCDPAAGSGHFLVKANDALGAELARVRSGDPYPTEAQIQAAKRDVLARCIYAVDLNPMAVELCKVSLWINASVRDRPLSFLDHHIKCGNSLIGAMVRPGSPQAPELMADGVPYEAFDHTLVGNDRQLTVAVRKQNREERREFEKGGGVQMALFQVTAVLETMDDLVQWAELNRLAEERPQAARERYEAYRADEKMARIKLIADTWTAAFFWPVTEEAPPPPTFDTFRRVQAQGRAALSESQQRMVAALAERYRFFHWHLEFRDVFPSPWEGEGPGVRVGGFDVVLGNPPWERIKLQEKEFFADKDAEIANARTASARRKLIKRLPQSDPDLHAAYIDALRESEATSHFLRESGRYPLSAVGDINTYQVFAGLVRQIVGPAGRVGVVIPSGIATDYYNQDYFSTIVEEQELVSFYDFENRRGLFSEVHRSYKFSLLTLRAVRQRKLSSLSSFILLMTWPIRSGASRSARTR